MSKTISSTSLRITHTRGRYELKITKGSGKSREFGEAIIALVRNEMQGFEEEEQQHASEQQADQGERHVPRHRSGGRYRSTRKVHAGSRATAGPNGG